MFNKVIIVGNLTRDLELRYTPTGTAVGSCGIASTRKFKSGDQQKEEVLFVDITFFGRTAEIANQYLRKGSKVLVEGRLKLDSWTDQNGAKRSKHSVVVENMTMLDSKGEGSRSESYNQQQNQASYNENQQVNKQTPQSMQKEDDIPSYDIDKDEIPSVDIDDEEIPF
jgi:single-strand DNA-binding protein